MTKRAKNVVHVPFDLFVTLTQQRHDAHHGAFAEHMNVAAVNETLCRLGEETVTHVGALRTYTYSSAATDHSVMYRQNFASR